MLTIKDLDMMQPSIVFRKIETLTNKFIAKRGGISDWAIYCGPLTWDFAIIEQIGDKIYDTDTIRDLVPCDDEALAAYRT